MLAMNKVMPKAKGASKTKAASNMKRSIACHSMGLEANKLPLGMTLYWWLSIFIEASYIGFDQR